MVGAGMHVQEKTKASERLHDSKYCDAVLFIVPNTCEIDIVNATLSEDWPSMVSHGISAGALL
jgi:hypothetical protein